MTNAWSGRVTGYSMFLVIGLCLFAAGIPKQRFLNISPLNYLFGLAKDSSKHNFGSNCSQVLLAYQSFSPRIHNALLHCYSEDFYLMASLISYYVFSSGRYSKYNNKQLLTTIISEVRQETGIEIKNLIKIKNGRDDVTIPSDPLLLPFHFSSLFFLILWFSLESRFNFSS